ncbi:small hydrophilic protein [Streptomyces sp. NPDC048172]|uniref:small hydrophilic protein n=1 Tax=Streptomyces sp. NPDC048172 TaxID=3365505 RepID=UPI003710946E
MAFSHRIATLAAVVAIPLGIAVTSYALTDSPDTPEPPAKVELESGSPDPSGSPSGSPSKSPKSSEPAPSGDETVSQPPATDDDGNDDSDDKGEKDDDGPGDDG